MDDVADWTALNERRIAPTTAYLALLTLSQVFRYGVRRGWIASNPVSGLEPAEKPHWTPQPVAILEPDKLQQLLAHARTPFLFAFLAHTGLRIGEGLGLQWGDIDYDQHLIRVHQQLGRDRKLTTLKTPASRREVVLGKVLATQLREHRLASPHKALDDFVFPRYDGQGLDSRSVGRDFRNAVAAAGIDHVGRLSLHSLRHTFASMLIASGLDVVYVSRQLGHRNPNITLGTYAHLFQKASHAATAREALDANWEGLNRLGT
jgi:integrase